MNGDLCCIHILDCGIPAGTLSPFACSTEANVCFVFIKYFDGVGRFVGCVHVVKC